MKEYAVLTIEDKVKYPFLPDVTDYIRSLGFTLADLESGIGEQILERASARVIGSIEEGRIPGECEDYDIEILSFPVAILLVSLIGDRRLTEKYAVAEARRVREYLVKENDEKILYIAVRGLSWSVKPVNSELWGRNFRYAILYANYLENLPEYRGMWKMINHPLVGGYVYVTRYELVRLIEQGVRALIRTKVDNARSIAENAPDAVYRYLEKISKVWSGYAARFEPVKVTESEAEDAYPPCIRKLLEDQLSGKNLPHSARFALAAFLINIGKSVDEVLEIFRSSPDFREDMARYQIEHIAGLRGSRTKYLPFKCENMRALGLCVWECRGVKHPLQYFYRRLRGRKIDVRKLTS